MKLSNQELNTMYDALNREKARIMIEYLKLPRAFQSLNKAVKTVVEIQAKIHQEQLTRART